jgi:hypothetical protein
VTVGNAARQRDIDPNQLLVDQYLARAMEEFDSNRLSTRLIRRLAEEFPGFFFKPKFLP